MPTEPLEPGRPHQCVAHSKRTGDRCGRDAIQGGTVCRYHGGLAPQVQKKAQERILAMVDPALWQLAILVEEAETDAVKLAAIRDVLDRAGYGAKHKLELDVTYKRLIGVPEDEV